MHTLELNQHKTSIIYRCRFSFDLISDYKNITTNHTHEKIMLYSNFFYQAVVL